jgi:hypothetical protein
MSVDTPSPTPITAKSVEQEIAKRRRKRREKGCEKILSLLRKEFTHEVIANALVDGEGRGCVVLIGIRFSRRSTVEDIRFCWEKCVDEYIYTIVDRTSYKCTFSHEEEEDSLIITEVVIKPRKIHQPVAGASNRMRDFIEWIGVLFLSCWPLYERI